MRKKWGILLTILVMGSCITTQSITSTKESTKETFFTYEKDSTLVNGEVYLQSFDTIEIRTPVFIDKEHRIFIDKYICDTIFIVDSILQFISSDTVRNEGDYIGAMGLVNNGELEAYAYFIDDSIKIDFETWVLYQKENRETITTITNQTEIVKEKKNLWQRVKTRILIAIAVLIVIAITLRR